MSDQVKVIKIKSYDEVVCEMKPFFQLCLFSPDLSAVTIEALPSNFQPFLGERMALNCSADSNKVVRYAWLHDEKILKGGDNHGVLIISNVAMETGGSYKCKASVGTFVEKKKFDVKVQCMCFLVRSTLPTNFE